MRNFSWVLDYKLAGSAMVGRWRSLDADIEELRDRGVSLLVTLTLEAIDPTALRAGGIEPLHLPVRDFGVPTFEQLDTFVERTTEAITRGGAVAAHCFAGMGRTGTFLASYLAATELDAKGAIGMIRELRPGSIETYEQERIVVDYAQRVKDK